MPTFVPATDHTPRHLVATILPLLRHSYLPALVDTKRQSRRYTPAHTLETHTGLALLFHSLFPGTFGPELFCSSGFLPLCRRDQTVRRKEDRGTRSNVNLPLSGGRSHPVAFEQPALAHDLSMLSGSPSVLRRPSCEPNLPASLHSFHPFSVLHSSLDSGRLECSASVRHRNRATRPKLTLSPNPTFFSSSLPNTISARATNVSI